MLDEGGERLITAPQAPAVAEREVPAQANAPPPAAEPAPAEQPVQQDAALTPPVTARAQRRESARILQENAESTVTGAERQARTGAAAPDPSRASAGEAATAGKNKDIVAARPAEAPSAPAPPAQAAAKVAKLEGEPPAVWLERIVTLRREGRGVEADALLAEFELRFPRAALPAEAR